MKLIQYSIYIFCLSAIINIPAVQASLINNTVNSENKIKEKFLTADFHKQERFIAQNNPSNTIAEITNIQINETEIGLEIILETSTGKQLVPLILPEDNKLIIDILDTTLALETGKQFSQINPIPGITEIKLQQIDDTSVRLTITGENKPPKAEVVPTENNLILSVTTASDDITSNLDDADITITVTGTRTPRLLLDSSSSIIVIDSEQIDQQLIQDLDDLVRYEPGVSVGRNPNRFGVQDFNIRGIDGNRVLLQVDGIRLPDNFVGRGRDFFDLETTKRVEIIKGAASALYGSDAIGGVVSFITKDPNDYLAIFDDTLYTSIKTSYRSTDESIGTTGVIAAEDETGTIQASVNFSFFNGSEFKNAGDIRANPQDVEDINLLAKLVYNINEKNSLKLTGELFNSRTDTDLVDEQGLTPFDVGNPPFFVFFDRQESQAEDTKER